MNEQEKSATVSGSRQEPVVMVPVVEASGHCGDCPFLAPYEHPFYRYSAWCWKQMRGLEWYDYWIADCAGNEPDEVLVKLRNYGNTKAP